MLARLLEPRDFGIMGIAMIFSGLVTRFGNIGFGLALIQRKEIREEHVSSLFTANLVIFFSLTGVMAGESKMMGTYFHEPLAGKVIGVMALNFLVTPFSSVARSVMQRNMDFKGPVVAGIVDHFFSIIVAIGFALKGAGVWSLVIGRLLGSLCSTFTLVAASRWRPRIRYEHSAMKDLFSFGVGMFFKNMFIYATDKIDYFIIGKRLGAAPLGLYEKAFNLMDLAVKEFSVRISSVLFTAFSRMKDDRSRLLSAYSKVILTLSLIMYPIFIGLYIVAPSFIIVLYGEKWVASILPLRIMCIAGLLRMHLQVTSTIVNAMGMVQPEIWRRGVAFIILALGVWFGCLWGINGAAVAVTVTTFILAIMMIAYLRHITTLTIYDFIHPQLHAFLASVFMATAVVSFQRLTEDTLGLHSIGMLFSSVFVGATAYVLSFVVMRPVAVVALMKEFIMDARTLKANRV